MDIQRYTDRFTKRSKTCSSMRPQLTSIMTLTPANFPSELYGKTSKRKNRNLGSLVNANRATEGTPSCAFIHFAIFPGLCALVLTGKKPAAELYSMTRAQARSIYPFRASATGRLTTSHSMHPHAWRKRTPNP